MKDGQGWKLCHSPAILVIIHKQSHKTDRECFSAAMGRCQVQQMRIETVYGLWRKTESTFFTRMREISTG